MKLTSTSRSEWLKKVSCANPDFFVRVRTKYRTFFTHNSQQKHPSITDRPSKPCPMAPESSDDGRQSHPTPSLMPHLASIALEAVNFAVGLTKQPPRQHKNEAMADSSCSSAQDVLGREGQ
jgi:hypothetical protein